MLIITHSLFVRHTIIKISHKGRRLSLNISSQVSFTRACSFPSATVYVTARIVCLSAPCHRPLTVYMHIISHGEQHGLPLVPTTRQLHLHTHTETITLAEILQLSQVYFPPVTACSKHHAVMHWRLSDTCGSTVTDSGSSCYEYHCRAA